jgi:hypothetical protein
MSSAYGGAVMLPTRWWTPEDRAQAVRLVTRHPWLSGGVLALFAAYAVYAISGSWVRALIVGVITCLAIRFGVGPYIVRLQKRDEQDEAL